MNRNASGVKRWAFQNKYLAAVIVSLLFSVTAFGQFQPVTTPLYYHRIKTRVLIQLQDTLLKPSIQDTNSIAWCCVPPKRQYMWRLRTSPNTQLFWDTTAGGTGGVGLVGDTVLYRDSTLGGNGIPPTPLGVNGRIAIPYIINPHDYGIKPDGIDHTAAFKHLLDSLNGAGGGWIQFSSGTYKFSGKIVMPLLFSDPTLPEMKGIRISGTASGANGRVYVNNLGATKWDLTYVGSPAKIDTRGAGRLEISNIAFINTNTASDSTPFIQTTNTSLYIHDCSFTGAGAGYTASITDGIILGGTSSVTDTAVNAGFQGYGTTIQTNFFDRMRRGVYGKIYANAITVENNTFWNASGGTVNTPGIEFRGDAANSCAGVKVLNNLFELVGYKYGIKLMYCVGFTVHGNTYFDRNGYNLWPVYAGTGTEYNDITESFAEGLTTSVYDSLSVATGLPSKNYIHSSLQGGTNIIPNNVDISGELYKRGSYGPRVYDNNGNSSYWVTIGGASNGALVHYLAYKPASAAEEVLVSYDRPATAGLNVIFGYAATSYVKFKSAAGHMYFNVPVGKELWFGEAGLEKHYISGGVFTAVGKPFIYSAVPHALMTTGENIPSWVVIDSTITARAASNYLAGAGIDISGTPKVVTNTLATGLAGGQGLFGGSGPNENLNVGSTTHGTKGSIFWGTTAQFKEGNGWLGIGKSPFSALDVTTPYVSGQTLVHLESATGAGFAYGLYIDGARDSGLTATISNLATAATANAELRIVAKDGTSGDPFLRWTNGVIDFSSGIDNSDADNWKLGPFANPSLVTTGIKMNASGDLYYLHSKEFAETGADTMAIPKWGQVLRKIGAGGGGGTVTSVALSMPGVIFNSSVTGSPVTTSGTLSPTLATQTANTVLAGPTSGGAATPTFRALVSADVPTLNQNTTGTAANVTGTVAIANGGTGQTSASNAFNALSPNTTLGDITYGSGTNTSTRLAGNTTTTKKFLTQTGNGSVSAAPAWGTIATGDLPTGIANANLANSSISWATGGTGSAAISWAASPTALGGTATLQITKATGANTGVIDAIDYARAFSVQSNLSNPTGTITINADLGGVQPIDFTGTGGRTLAFSNLRNGDRIEIWINNTSGATITLTMPSNSRLFGTGSVSTITIPTGFSMLGLTRYDGTNSVFSLGTY